MLELLRVVVSLAVVLGLFWVVARLGSRKLGGRDRGLVRVRSRQSLSRGSSLAVVEVGSRVLVVGVSDGGVRLLTELDPVEGVETAPAAQPAGAVELVEAAEAATVTRLQPRAPGRHAAPVAAAEVSFAELLAQATEAHEADQAAVAGDPVAKHAARPGKHAAQPVSQPVSPPALPPVFQPLVPPVAQPAARQLALPQPVAQPVAQTVAPVEAPVARPARRPAGAHRATSAPATAPSASAASPSRLSGSLLSAGTWRQALAATGRTRDAGGTA